MKRKEVEGRKQGRETGAGKGGGRCSRHESFLYSDGSDDNDVRWATWARTLYYEGVRGRYAGGVV